MASKKEIISELKQYSNNSGVIIKQQIAEYYGTKKPGTRVNRLVENLPAVEGKYYFVQDVAEELLRRSML